MLFPLCKIFYGIFVDNSCRSSKWFILGRIWYWGCEDRLSENRCSNTVLQSQQRFPGNWAVHLGLPMMDHWMLGTFFNFLSTTTCYFCHNCRGHDDVVVKEVWYRRTLKVFFILPVLVSVQFPQIDFSLWCDNISVE